MMEHVSGFVAGFLYAALGAIPCGPDCYSGRCDCPACAAFGESDPSPLSAFMSLAPSSWRWWDEEDI